MVTQTTTMGHQRSNDFQARWLLLAFKVSHLHCATEPVHMSHNPQGMLAALAHTENFLLRLRSTFKLDGRRHDSTPTQSTRARMMSIKVPSMNTVPHDRGHGHLHAKKEATPLCCPAGAIDLSQLPIYHSDIGLVAGKLSSLRAI